MTVYTLGLWRVRPAQEEAFVEAWQEMANRTRESFPDATAVLLRDRDDPSLFISTGPWTSMDEVSRWRSSNAFQDGVAQIHPHLESFDPHALDEVVVVGP